MPPKKKTQENKTVEGTNIPKVLVQLACTIFCSAIYLWLWWVLGYHNPDVISNDSNECYVEVDS